MRLFGLIGYPLSHSFSEKYFTEKFEREGWADCRYELFPLETIDGLPQLLQDHPRLEGLNVTIPYKKQVLPFLHSTGGIPGGLEACNCIRIREGILEGFNTDCSGFEKSLVPLLAPRHTKALVLGSGGASAAVTYVLGQLKISWKIVSRHKSGRAVLTYDELGEKTIREHTLIINTTPMGMSPHPETCPPIPYEFISDNHLLYDLVYNPAKTLFLQKGEEHGARIKNGEEMLILQAEESWRIWNVF